MHFERIRKKLNFVNAWKLFLAKEKEKQIQIWASNAQWNVKILRGLECNGKNVSKLGRRKA